jgi:hypothetical protein
MGEEEMGWIRKKWRDGNRSGKKKWSEWFV